VNLLAGRSRPALIEGYAIVSADGMIAEANGSMDALRFDADQQFFWASLDTAAAVAHGRHSAEGGPKAAGRHRLILTRRITAVRFDWHKTHCWARGGFAIPSESAASFLDALTNGFVKRGLISKEGCRCRLTICFVIGV
jgi:hypothetical protein